MNDLEEFKRCLLQEGKSYQLLSPLPAPQVTLRFVAYFDRQERIWLAHVLTLRHWADISRCRCVRSFIDVQSMQDVHGRVQIGLPVEQVDHAVILKCLVMVRNYKRLKLGRHEFGDTHVFDV